MWGGHGAPEAWPGGMQWRVWHREDVRSLGAVETGIADQSDQKLHPPCARKETIISTIKSQTQTELLQLTYILWLLLKDYNAGFCQFINRLIIAFIINPIKKICTYPSGTRIEVSGRCYVLRRYMAGPWVVMMMKQGRDGARMKRNLWQTAGRDVLHVTRWQLHTASWDGPCGCCAAHGVMGARTDGEVRPRTDRDCIWSHGDRCADRNLWKKNNISCYKAWWWLGTAVCYAAVWRTGPIATLLTTVKWYTYVNLAHYLLCIHPTLNTIDYSLGHCVQGL